MSSHRHSPQKPHDRSAGCNEFHGRPSRKSQAQTFPSSSVVRPWHRLNSPPPTNDPTLYGEAPLSPPPDTPRPFHVVAAAPAQTDPEPPSSEMFDDFWADDLFQFGWLPEDKPTSDEDEAYYLSPAASKTFSPIKASKAPVKRKASCFPPPSPTPKRVAKRRKVQTMVAVKVRRPLNFNPDEYEPLRVEEDGSGGGDLDSLDGSTVERLWGKEGGYCM
ncbi:hypothetical protein BO78DRAFT_396783 [Aspergillus sclerotiicarbonarius CBS 121057]|uniref:Uncharacterized protein n=1 Tax=Aspergillus sclerotiicarbonarius (strain CBS 121057 / IBT 28362) TaxID=1448318 RepID=A0A319EA76_ASPSB|nr:hypothetical protein BO78DRAFT_396783 [Aspergillus sclerotiicarbonarius CBS 121057]